MKPRKRLLQRLKNLKDAFNKKKGGLNIYGLNERHKET